MSRFVVAALCAAAALAPSTPTAAQTPGRWAPWAEAGSTAGVPAAAVPVLRSHAETVLATMFRAAPVLANPDATWWGLRVRSVGRAEDDVWTEGPTRWPLGARFDASVIRAWRDEAGRARWEPTEARRSIGLSVATNSLKCVFPSQHQPSYQDAEGPIYEAPVKTDEVGGFPVYNTDCLAITARQAPLFLPATRERVARLILARARATLADADRGMAEARKAGLPQAAAEMQETRDAFARDVAQWSARIAGMSPSERAAPAHVRLEALQVGSEVAQPFADGPGESVVSLVAPNPGFFDPRDPTRVQLITVAIKETGPLGCVHPACEPADEAFFEQFRAQMDWRALAALTGP